VTDDARHAVVTALIGLAESPDHRDRADAGRGLASFAEIPEAGRALAGLVLDPGDTFVTRETATALLRRQDTVGLAIVASALAAAGPHHTDWIHTAVHDVFMMFSRDRDAALRECDALTRDPDDQIRRGGRQLTDVLEEIAPILH
jgi:hypothetical protein